MSSEEKVTIVRSVQKESGIRQRFVSFKATQIILWFFSILETMIALRIVLKLIGANPESFIVSLIYGITSPFLIPFAGVIRSPATDGMVLEISSIFAIVIYALIAVAFEKLVWVIVSRPRSTESSVTETTVNDNQKNP